MTDAHMRAVMRFVHVAAVEASKGIAPPWPSPPGCRYAFFVAALATLSLSLLRAALALSALVSVRESTSQQLVEWRRRRELV